MRGRSPAEYKLEAQDRTDLQQLLGEGALSQRVARRVQALLALDRGERIGAIVHWVGLSPAALWYLWRRYQERSLAAICDAARSGRPAVFSLARAGGDRAHRLYRAQRLRPAPDAVGQPEPGSGGGGAGRS